MLYYRPGQNNEVIEDKDKIQRGHKNAQNQQKDINFRLKQSKCDLFNTYLN